MLTNGTQHKEKETQLSMHTDRHANRQNYVSNYAQAVQIYVPHLTLLKSASTDVAVVGVSRN